MLKQEGTLSMMGASDKPIDLNVFPLIFNLRNYTRFAQTLLNGQGGVNSQNYGVWRTSRIARSKA